VSGGKDSLAVWDLLLELGYQADGLYIGLGIGDYSDVSASTPARSPPSAGLHLIEIDLRGEYGYDIPDGGEGHQAGAVLGVRLSKRHLFDKAAIDGGYTCWSPATTSTTRRPCCSATRCAGRSSTSPASCPCCRRATASRRR
jgi:tRNA(Ile)-lysidine synthase TilS/MesJ